MRGHVASRNVDTRRPRWRVSPHGVDIGRASSDPAPIKPSTPKPITQHHTAIESCRLILDLLVMPIRLDRPSGRTTVNRGHMRVLPRCVSQPLLQDHLRTVIYL